MAFELLTQNHLLRPHTQQKRVVGQHKNIYIILIHSACEQEISTGNDGAWNSTIMLAGCCCFTWLIVLSQLFLASPTSMSFILDCIRWKLSNLVKSLLKFPSLELKSHKNEKRFGILYFTLRLNVSRNSLLNANVSQHTRPKMKLWSQCWSAFHHCLDVGLII